MLFIHHMLSFTNFFTSITFRRCPWQEFSNLYIFQSYPVPRVLVLVRKHAHFLITKENNKDMYINLNLTGNLKVS